MDFVVKRMLINASAAEEVRMAMVEDGVLTDLDVEIASREKTRGNIYKGIVANVEASLGAAFIEFGQAKQAFLAFDDIRPELWDPSWKGEGRPKITDIIHRKQEIIVQVIKEEMGTKGAAVTTFLSLPGRYVVLMHSGGGRGGVSRKIDDERERAKAKEALDKLKVPDDLGVIIRTAGTGKSRPELQNDLNNLGKQWAKMMQASDIARAPSLLYREPDLVVRTIRDYLTPDVNEVLVDSQDEHEEVMDYFSQGEDVGEEATGPKAADLIKLYEGKVPLFEKYNVEEQIEGLFKRQVPLPSGGYLVIDQTEALVSIDVNSGKSTREGDHEATVYKTNLEAVSETARQLRLRDMGGIVVVDLIDMASRKHERDVEQRLKEALKADKARVKVGRISENGLLELTRQRLRQAHRLVSHVPCQACAGTGVVRAVPGQAVAALREMQARAAAAQGTMAKVSVRLPLDAANHLNNHKRMELDALAKQWDCQVEVLADHTLGQGDSKFEEEKRGRAAMNAPDRPVVKDEDWKPRRRFRGGDDTEDKPAPQTIEDRQEAQFQADRGRSRPSGGPRGWDRDRDRSRFRDRSGAPERPSLQSADRKAQQESGREGRPALVAEDIRSALPPPKKPEYTGPRHYPDDALMDALFGDPPEMTPEVMVAGQPLEPVAMAADGTVTASVVAAAPAAAQAVGTPGAVVMAPDGTIVVLGEDGQAKKRRRRRRRRRKGGGIDPLTGLPFPPQPNQAGGAQSQDEDDGEEDGEDDGVEEGAPGASPSVPASHMAPAAAVAEAAAMAATLPVVSTHGGDLMAAATEVLLGGTSMVTPPKMPSGNDLQARLASTPPLSSFLSATEMALVQDAPAAHVDEDDDEGDEDEDGEDGDEAANLPPMPPPGPDTHDAAARAEEPTVVAKKSAAKKPAAKSKTPAKAAAKKKPAAKKKAAAKKG